MATVSTDAIWAIYVYGADPGSVSVAHYELRRHMTTDADLPLKINGANFTQGRAGRPYRAWTTQELMATIQLNPVVKLAISQGRPVSIIAERTDIATPAILASRAAAAIDRGAGVVTSIARRAATAAGEIAGAAGAGAALGASAVAIGPILLALSGLVVLYVFRKPIGQFAKGLLR